MHQLRIKLLINSGVCIDSEICSLGKQTSWVVPRNSPLLYLRCSYLLNNGICEILNNSDSRYFNEALRENIWLYKQFTIFRSGVVADLRQHPHQYRSIQFPHNSQTSSNSSTIAAGSSNGLTSTRYCKYSCVCSLLWVEVLPETCRA